MPESRESRGADGSGPCPWPCAGLGQHIDALLETANVVEMGEAARRLDSDANSIIDLLKRVHPLVRDSLGADPSERHAELVKAALDLASAAHYLLGLLDSSASASPAFALADDAGWSLEGGVAEAARDRLMRRRLDARSMSAQRAMHLLSRIPCDVCQPGEAASPSCGQVISGNVSTLHA